MLGIFLIFPFSEDKIILIYPLSVVIDNWFLFVFSSFKKNPCSGEEMGSVICFNLEYGCLAHAHQLLFQDCDCNCTEFS